MKKGLTSAEYATKFLNDEYSHVLEFGVWKGDSLRSICNMLPENKYKVFGFDSFTGLPEDWKDGQGKLVGRGKKGRFSTDGAVPNIKNVKFFKGWFTETIPEYLKEGDSIALLHVDCDLYSSTKQVLEGLNKHILPGTVIVFDEWFYNHSADFNDHEQKAFKEWVIDFDRKFEFIDYVDPTDTVNYDVSERKIVRILE